MRVFARRDAGRAADSSKARRRGANARGGGAPDRLGDLVVRRLRELGPRRVAIAVGLLFIGVAALFAWRLAETPPEWFLERAAAAGDRATRPAAVAAENRALTVLSAQRQPGDLWRLELSEDDANAWLAHRLRPWLDREYPGLWPERLRTIAVDFRPGRILVGLAFADASPGEIDRPVPTPGEVLVIVLEPTGVPLYSGVDGASDPAHEATAADSGAADLADPPPAARGPAGPRLTFRVASVALNRLPAPAGPITRGLVERLLPAELLDTDHRRHLRVAAQGKPLPLDTTIAIDRRTRARPLQAEISHARLVLTMETTAR